MGMRRSIPGRRWWGIGGGIVVTVVIVACSAGFLVDEPLRRSMERELNQRLKGYTAQVGALDFHPLGFSLDLENVVIRQQAHPEPPVAVIPRLSASVQWRALLFGRLVGNVAIERPSVTLNLQQARREIQDPVPVIERGWQDALEAVYPLKINHLAIHDGEVVYRDEGRFKPLHLRHIDITAGNIRNVRSREGPCPSVLSGQAQVFERGRVTIDGRADFLAAPHPGVQADIALEGVELDYFRPITGRYNVSVRGGSLSAKGRVEYAPTVKAADLQEAHVEGVAVEYVHRARTAPVEHQRLRETARAAAEAADKPGVMIRVGQLDVARSTAGFVNTVTTPDYRLFVDDLTVRVRNLSNQSQAGLGDVEIRGRFMGSGPLSARVSYRPAQPRPDMRIETSITRAQMKDMNDLFRAYGKFDVVSGEFSFYSEISVENGVVSGYVKPLFKNVDVYDPAQDRDKNVFRRAYEAMVGAIATLLENRPRDEVATRVALSGRIDNPRVSTLEAILGLVKNAFTKAIQPGLEREGRRTPHRSQS